ncbi:hypothetical protein [Enterococcus caccae]|uniref:Uncharacterized protein n=1 Tax=Enterococcus caccae ATCC BAA-1240 TaxID=1158612 RepID=R3W591_9ENTE|nr:hypothetical protein [Enterococcus caccae]EOL42767.1 hypothetical protein UC7_03175 [Enterococcus caccae ATCC BAA-1240]EOT67755.1 hypothetical protein I580_00137 [Enterococcus caccae ATCC BAA-1240]OJG28756.1 hypothetical protein RU98_GL000349 [Enterococcus caccae]
MEREISVELTCKNCENKMIGKFLLNTRTDKENHQRVNIPLGELNLSGDEIELVCDDTIVDDEINLHYNCKNCGTKNHVTILITDEMK